MGVEVGLLVDADFLSRDISSAIVLALVLIHVELMPTLNQLKVRKRILRVLDQFLTFYKCASSIFCAHIVCDTQDNWMWIVISAFVLGIENQSREVVNNNGDILEAIYRYKPLVLFAGSV